MTFEELAKKLDRDLVLRFSPKKEDPSKPYNFIDNPRPYHVQTCDYSHFVGVGATPDEACRALADSAIEAARASLARHTEDRRQAYDNLEALTDKLKQKETT